MRQIEMGLLPAIFVGVAFVVVFLIVLPVGSAIWGFPLNAFSQILSQSIKGPLLLVTVTAPTAIFVGMVCLVTWDPNRRLPLPVSLLIILVVFDLASTVLMTGLGGIFFGTKSLAALLEFPMVYKFGVIFWGIAPIVSLIIAFIGGGICESLDREPGGC